MDNKQKGNLGEDRACELLRKSGYKILLRNHKTKFGEIDIIAKEKDCLVFIEVKARRSDSFGSPLEAITKYKKNNIRKSALSFLNNPGVKFKSVRFDIVSITCDKVEIVKDAIDFS